MANFSMYAIFFYSDLIVNSKNKINLSGCRVSSEEAVSVMTVVAVGKSVLSGN